MMKDAEFWSLIDEARQQAGDDLDQMEAELMDVLSTLPPGKIEDFSEILCSKVDAAYNWNLWGAAYVINGGCSDDGFEYFRAWLVSRGQRAYENALAKPDSLADVLVDGDVPEFETLMYAASKAFENSTGQKMKHRPRKIQREPHGEQWDFDVREEMARRFPRLSKLFS